MRLAAVLLFFKEPHFIEACVRAIYPVVDSICCPSQVDRNFAGREITPDETLQRLLSTPDPDNKLRLVIKRNLDDVPGDDTEARLRHAAMALDPRADYYLIVDSDEIWPRAVLQQAWEQVQSGREACYRIGHHGYFKSWNYRIVEPGDGYRPVVFVRRGIRFGEGRRVRLGGATRWREYLISGHRPRSVLLPSELRMHHGLAVGDDERILTKLKNFGHSASVDPTWFDRTWKNFHPDMRNLHFFKDADSGMERLEKIPTAQLPAEIRDRPWPEGWIEREPGP
jgi:hypothetical protein